MTDDAYTYKGTIEPVGMLPKRTPECNWTYFLGGGGGEMPCHRDIENEIVTTFWIPQNELPIPHLDKHWNGADFDFAIHIVYINFKPKIEIGFGSTIEEANLEERELEPYEFAEAGSNEWWTSMGFDVHSLDYMNSDVGLAVIRCHQLPPPPVAVWIA